MKYALHADPGIVHIEMEGAFSFVDSRAFHHLLGVLRDSPHIGEIRFHVRALLSVDSTALSLLMKAFDAAKKAHRNFVFVGPRGQVQEALAAAALYNAFQVTS